MVERKKTIKDLLSADEIRGLLKVSDTKGAGALLSTWGSIIVLLGMVALWPNAFTVVFGIILLGGQQLALAILMHEAAHRTLFTSHRLNDFVGHWLCAMPLWLNLQGYRKHHLDHHRYNWKEADPDLGLANGYPVTKKSMRRKLMRDFLGVTGLKGIYGHLLIDFGFIEFTISNKVTPIDQTGRHFFHVVKTGLKPFSGFLLTHAVLFGLCFLAGHPWVYLMWWGAFLTTYNAFIRIRSIAEHAVIPDPQDEFQNTRTTQANFLARLLVAPHHVNYHLEHHLLMTVPQHNLPLFNRRLKELKIFDEGNSASGYVEVLRKAVV